MALVRKQNTGMFSEDGERSTETGNATETVGIGKERVKDSEQLLQEPWATAPYRRSPYPMGHRAGKRELCSFDSTFVVHLAVVCTSAADGEQSCTSATCLFNQGLSGEGTNEDRWAVLVTSESGS